MAPQTEHRAVPDASASSPELRLLDRRAFVGFPALALAPGVVITDFALQVPDVTFPFNLTGGALRYQRRTLQFGFLELTVDAEVIARGVQLVSAQLVDMDELKLHFRPGYLEGQARFKTPERTPVTFKVAFDGEGEKLAVYLYDVRLYGFTATPAAQVPVLLSRALQDLQLFPDVELRGASGCTARVLPQLCQLAAVSRGFKVPRLDQARLSAAEVSSQGLRLRFSSGGLPPPANADEELLLTLEGARAFADAETLVAQGRLADAREAYLKLGDVHDAHPFAAERLLGLLVADPQAHELALDICASLQRRREKSPTAIWAEAVVRERRGESARAAERYLALCALARKNSEDASAFFAAESAARAGRDQAPQMAVRALHELLGIRPDHLPSLQALARASDQASDRAGAIRAYRRIAALTRDPSEAADAHVHMARLCAETEDDIAGARLHCEAALRLAPDHPDALYHLGELCYRSGEHLRALKALDRLREVALARHEVDRVGRASALAGKVWELGLHQPENSLLRYREAVSLMPSEPEPHFFAARVAESLGKIQDALSDYLQTVELAGPAPRSDDIRRAAHASHHALSRLYRSRLADPAKAKDHLEAALALDPKDAAALEELIPYFRAAARGPELADACEKAALISEDPARRAALWAEAGELFRGRLGNLEKAERLLNSALEADPRNRVALEGMLALAESRRDGGQLCRCLKALAELATDLKDRARLLRRLGVAARDLAFDLELATFALTEVLKLEPDDLAALGELCGLQRKRADMSGLAVALEQRARVAEAHNDKRLASAALRELAQVLELRLGRVGEALIAMEKAARLSPDPGVLLDLADLSLRCERPEHARRALYDLLAQLPKTAAPERIAEIRSRIGKACDLLGDRDGARESYALAFPLRPLDDELAARLEALYQDPAHARDRSELWATRARALLEADRAEAAAPLFVKSANAFMERGEHEQALVFLHHALDASPQGALAGDVLESMAELELQRGSKLEAARLYAQRAATLTDSRAAARMFFKAVSLSTGSTRELALLAQAIEKDPTYAPARNRRAELTADSDPHDALVDLEAALATPHADPDAPATAERLSFTRRAAVVASHAGHEETARKYLALYIAQKPEDLEASRELADLHRRAGATEPLCDLLGELWPRLQGATQLAALREFAELSLELGRPAAASDALRQLRAQNPDDVWSARHLFDLLPPPAMASRQQEVERLELLSVLVDHALGDERAQLLSQRAMLNRAAGRLAEARADLGRAAESAVDPKDYLRRAAELAREAGDEAAELIAWRHALARAPSLAAVASIRLLALARTRLATGDFAAAREGFSACVDLGLSAGERAEAYWGLAEAALGLGDSQSAIAALLEASQDGTPQRRFDALARRAELLEQQGSLALAIESLEKALILAPRNAVAIAGMKRLLRQVEDWSGLAELLSTEAANAPKAASIALYEELGALYLEKLKQTGPAEAAYRKIAQLDRTHVDARRRLASLLADRGELAEAGALLEEASGTLPRRDGASLLREAARRSHQAGESDLALRLARRALALDRPKGEDLALLVRLLYLKGSVQEALPLAEELGAAVEFKENPEFAEESMLLLADIAEQVGQRPVAERALRRVVKERPLLGTAVERLSSLIASQNPRESVEVLWSFARTLSPSEKTVRLLLALGDRARNELADFELASQILVRAAEIAPDPLDIERRLSDLYRQAGRTHELLNTLSTVAALCAQQQDHAGAVAALEEKATLCEQMGRVDEALSTLTAVRALWEKEENRLNAARTERRRAELLSESKLDLPAAERSLEASFELSPELHTARGGLKLAERRDDTRAMAKWLERTASLSTDIKEKVGSLLRLAELSDQALGAHAQAETAVREAIRLDPSSTAAEVALTGILERDGRLSELAAFYEEAAERDPADRVALLRKAAGIYRDRAKNPSAAASALLAARASSPDDAELTAQLADLLHEAGRADDAAEFDALLLAADPFLPKIFERHRAYLQQNDDTQKVAALMFRRAELLEGSPAAEAYLEAAAAFRAARAEEQALLCERQAFEKAPGHDGAFQVVRARAESDVRRLSEILLRRADAVQEHEAVALLRVRAERLASAGELLLAAEAFDDLLARVPEDVDALSWRGELAAQGGGALAAQPYDRRLLRSQAALPDELRLKTQLRLGHAALSSNAMTDAADAFEAVVQLDPTGDKGSEALSLLAEVHSRTGDSAGLFRTSLRLAERAQPAEREALLRRAANLFPEPKDALEALLPLAQLRPNDPDIVSRTAAGLTSLGRFGDLLGLYERSAAAAGGPRAAELLLRAATLADAELFDPTKALELRERAGRMDPQNATVLEPLVAGLRARGDSAALVDALERLIDATPDDDRSAVMRMELAALLTRLNDEPRAREVLEQVVVKGPRTPRYGEALDALEQLVRKTGNASALARVLSAQGDRAEGAARAAIFLEAARLQHDVGASQPALDLLSQSVAAFATPEAALLQAELWRGLAHPAKAAEALTRAASLSEDSARGALLLEAAQVWEDAGDSARAIDLLERIAVEHSNLLPPRQFAARLERLGAVARALEVGFAPAMASGDPSRALALADAASDRGRAREALWSLVSRTHPDALHLARLADDLRRAEDAEGLLRLAELSEQGSPEAAYALYREVAVGELPVPARITALTRLVKQGHRAESLTDILPTLSDGASREWIDQCLLQVSASPAAQRPRLLSLAAAALPSRRRALLGQQLDLARSEGRLPAMVEALQQLIEVLEPGVERSSLYLELGALEQRLGNDPAGPQEAFERALADDLNSVQALEQLVPLYQRAGERVLFTAMVARLERLAGASAVSQYQESLLEAAEALGRKVDAYRILSALAETPERLARRAALASELGFLGESLQIRERLTEDPAERERILFGYLGADLMPFAVSLCERMLAQGPVAESTRRHAAERFSPTVEGAALAARLWPGLIRGDPGDADAWTLYAEALRNVGDLAKAERMDGFGAALTSSKATAPTAAMNTVPRPEPVDFTVPHPPGWVPLTQLTMPRLYAVLDEALTALGAPSMEISLHRTGGVEAYLLSRRELILGAGALSVFGAAELGFLCALALALGESGAALAVPGMVPNFDQAATEAFSAVPASLAASRVIAQLDESVRGTDPRQVNVAAVLKQSTAFRAVALQALLLE